MSTDQCANALNHLDEVNGMLRAISDELCRNVLRYLDYHKQDEVHISELSEWIESQVLDVDYIEVRLHHATLPKLAGNNLIEYDANDKLIRRKSGQLPHAQLIELVLEFEHG